MERHVVSPEPSITTIITAPQPPTRQVTGYSNDDENHTDNRASEPSDCNMDDEYDSDCDYDDPTPTMMDHDNIHDDDNDETHESLLDDCIATLFQLPRNAADDVAEAALVLGNEIQRRPAFCYTFVGLHGGGIPNTIQALVTFADHALVQLNGLWLLLQTVRAVPQFGSIVDRSCGPYLALKALDRFPRHGLVQLNGVALLNQVWDAAATDNDGKNRQKLMLQQWGRLAMGSVERALRQDWEEDGDHDSITDDDDNDDKKNAMMIDTSVNPTSEAARWLWRVSSDPLGQSFILQSGIPRVLLQLMARGDSVVVQGNFMTLLCRILRVNPPPPPSSSSTSGDGVGDHDTEEMPVDFHVERTW
mmetsp:Transcript_9457/g.23056  ORF Transcript_9457/g.23056 Transcript_9457/m.23056 type:complete len:361 (+) Transcript_9457:135-1217(+)